MERKYNRREKNKFKRIGFIFLSFLRFFTKQFLGFFILIPYFVNKIFFPNLKRDRRRISISKKLRYALEFRKSRQAIGVNIVLLLIFLTVLNPRIGASTVMASSALEENKVSLDLSSILTEKTFQRPTIGYISQFFTSYHFGIDYAGNYLADIYPIYDGVVSGIEKDWFGYGNSVLIDHGSGLISRYAHMEKISVEMGQSVSKQTSLGLVGSTGWSTGPHLHLETIYNGEKINPNILVGDK